MCAPPRPDEALRERRDGADEGDTTMARHTLPTDTATLGGFLADPGAVADWRFVVLADAAVQTGVLAALPGTAADVAARTGLDPHAVDVVLHALREWEIVDVEDDRFLPGSLSPTGEQADVVHHHALAIRRWSTEITGRLEGATPESRTVAPRQRETWIRALGAGARRNAPALADRALERFPDTRRVLDLAGGHGEYGLEFVRRGCEVTLQDLPDMIDIVSGWPSLAAAGVALFASDVFEEIAPGPFDLVVCTGFTHTQPPERVAELLRRIHAVTASGGGVAIHTLTRDDRPTGPIFAVMMLLGGRGGDCHGWDEYASWLDAAGYRDADLVETADRPLILATA